MSSRKEQKEALRAERERKAQEAAAAERRKKMIGYGAAGGLVLAAIVAIVVVVLASGGSDGGGGGKSAEPDAEDFAKASIPAQRADNLEVAAKAARCKVSTFPAEGRSHVDGRVEYKQNPPTSGNHNAFAAQDGPYLQAPEMEQLVHALEHGRVIVWFQPDAAAQAKGQVKALFDEDNYHMLIAPNTRKMPSQIAASSWTRSITCPKLNPQVWDAIRLFRDRYRDQGPERVA